MCVIKIYARLSKAVHHMDGLKLRPAEDALISTYFRVCSAESSNEL